MRVRVRLGLGVRVRLRVRLRVRFRDHPARFGMFTFERIANILVLHYSLNATNMGPGGAPMRQLGNSK